MEEVWGNISLPSLHYPTSTTKPPSLGELNSGTNFYDFFNNKDPYSDHQRQLANYPQTNSLSSINKMGFVENPSSSSSLVKKRASNTEDESANDRRRLRLMKNRESADRSRARRQAYTNELEQEIENLKKENARLRQQLQKEKPEKLVGILAAAAATTTKTGAAAAARASQIKSTKRSLLYRTLTAPF
ncbi:protein FD-like [Apium graveolens]|uniref:protein FD-like n=1 Tax=Apium graveolens TaxID=4045 RepID=UPI003D7BB11F